MIYHIFVDGESKSTVTASGYRKATAKAKKKGFTEFKVFREDDVMPKKKRKKKVKEITNVIDIGEETNEFYE